MWRTSKHAKPTRALLCTRSRKSTELLPLLLLLLESALLLLLEPVLRREAALLLEAVRLRLLRRRSGAWRAAAERV